MAVAYDAVGAGNAVLGTSTSWSHTCGASANYLIVGIAVGDNTSSHSYTTFTRTVTYNSVTMASLGVTNTDSNTAGFVELFGLANPSTGSAFTVSVTTSGSTAFSVVGNSVSYTGVQSRGTPVVGVIAGSAPSVTASSAANHIVTAVFASGAAISTPTQTQRALSNFNSASGAGNLLIQDVAGAASVTLGAASNADQWGWIAVDLSDTVVVTDTGKPAYPLVIPNKYVGPQSLRAAFRYKPLSRATILGFTKPSTTTTGTFTLTAGGVVDRNRARPVIIPNPNVGPMALRWRIHLRPPPWPIADLDGFTVDSPATTIAVGLTADGAVTTGGGDYTGTDTGTTVTLTLTADGVVGASTAAATTGTFTLTADGVVGANAGAAATTATLALTAAGVVGASTGATTTTGTFTLTAAGTAVAGLSQNSNPTTATFTLTAAGQVAASTGAATALTATLTAAGTTGVSQTTAATTGTFTLTAAGNTTVGLSQPSNPTTITATLTAGGQAGISAPSTATTATLTLTAAGTTGVSKTSTATALTATLTAAGSTGVSQPAATTTATFTLTAAGVVGTSRGATTTATLTLTAGGNLAAASGTPQTLVAITLIAGGQTTIGGQAGATVVVVALTADGVVQTVPPHPGPTDTWFVKAEDRNYRVKPQTTVHVLPTFTSGLHIAGTQTHTVAEQNTVQTI